jgi:spermidine synthase
MTGPLLLYLGHLSSLKLSFIFFILSAVSGFLVGSEFPLANKIYWRAKTHTKTAGILYALDLVGAWLAALVVSFALVPVVGILKTCVLLLVLKTISLVLVSSSKF